jgi:hypothetical protein
MEGCNICPSLYIEERRVLHRCFREFRSLTYLLCPGSLGVFVHVAPKRLGTRHPNALQFIHVPSQDPQVAYLFVVCGVLLDFWTLAYIRDAHQGLVAAMRSAVTVDTDRHRGCHRPETAKVTFTA